MKKKKVTIQEIIKEICKWQRKILSDKDLLESIAVYLFLKNEYEKNDRNNLVFQFVFRSFYGMDRAGLGPDLKKRFFELLERKEDRLEIILRALYKIPTLRKLHTVQFVFATKLLHTLDDGNPIFDAKVAKVIHKTVTGVSGDERIKSSLILYEYLKCVHCNLLKDSDITKIIRKFKEKFHVNQKQISDEKVLDFIIWTLGKLKSYKQR